METSYVPPIIFQKAISDSTVSSDLIIKKCTVNEETGFIEGGPQEFLISKRGTESKMASTGIAMSGYRYEYLLDIYEDSECVYTLKI